MVYLSITSDESLAGFIILVVDTASRSVEFRRIVVSATGQGVAQAVLLKTEECCIRVLDFERIWQDVFESNVRGIYDGQVLHFMEKRLLALTDPSPVPFYQSKVAFVAILGDSQ